MDNDQPNLGPGKEPASEIDREVARLRQKRVAPPEAGSRGRFIAAGVIIAALLYLLLPGSPPPAPPVPVSVGVPQQPATPPAPTVPLQQYDESIGPPAPPVTIKRPRPAGRAVIALVLDDCGISVSQTAPALDLLPPAVTLSFLPYGHATQRMAERAAKEGHTVMLHMPMQPVGRNDPGPEAVVPGLPAEEITRRVTESLAAVPGASGVNNHMGSAATADAPAMQAVMTALAGKNVFFLDSYTSNQSVAFRTALAAGLPAARRDVFLDDTITPEAIAIQLDRLEAVAYRQGSAIAIGHPHPATLEALKNWLPTLAEKGLDLVPVQNLLQKPQETR